MLTWGQVFQPKSVLRAKGVLHAMPRQLDRKRKRPVHCLLSHCAASCSLVVWVIAGGHPRLAMQHHGHGLRGAAA